MTTRRRSGDRAPRGQELRNVREDLGLTRLAVVHRLHDLAAADIRRRVDNISALEAIESHAVRDPALSWEVLDALSDVMVWILRCAMPALCAPSGAAAAEHPRELLRLVSSELGPESWDAAVAGELTLGLSTLRSMGRVIHTRGAGLHEEVARLFDTKSQTPVVSAEELMALCGHKGGYHYHMNGTADEWRTVTFTILLRTRDALASLRPLRAIMGADALPEAEVRALPLGALVAEALDLANSAESLLALLERTRKICGLRVRDRPRRITLGALAANVADLEAALDRDADVARRLEVMSLVLGESSREIGGEEGPLGLLLRTQVTIADAASLGLLTSNHLPETLEELSAALSSLAAQRDRIAALVDGLRAAEGEWGTATHVMSLDALVHEVVNSKAVRNLETIFGIGSGKARSEPGRPARGSEATGTVLAEAIALLDYARPLRPLFGLPPVARAESPTLAMIALEGVELVNARHSFLARLADARSLLGIAPVETEAEPMSVRALVEAGEAVRRTAAPVLAQVLAVEASLDQSAQVPSVEMPSLPDLVDRLGRADRMRRVRTQRRPGGGRRPGRPQAGPSLSEIVAVLPRDALARQTSELTRILGAESLVAPQTRAPTYSSMLILLRDTAEEISDLLDEAAGLRSVLGVTGGVRQWQEPASLAELVFQARLLTDGATALIKVLQRPDLTVPDVVPDGLPESATLRWIASRPDAVHWLITHIADNGPLVAGLIEELRISPRHLHAIIIDEDGPLRIPLPIHSLNFWLQGKHPLPRPAGSRIGQWVASQAAQVQPPSGPEVSAAMDALRIDDQSWLAAECAKLDPHLVISSKRFTMEAMSGRARKRGGFRFWELRCLDAVLAHMRDEDAREPLPLTPVLAGALDELGATDTELADAVMEARRESGDRARDTWKTYIGAIRKGTSVGRPSRPKLLALRAGLRLLRESRAMEEVWEGIDPLRDGSWVRDQAEGAGLTVDDMLGLVTPPVRLRLANWTAVERYWSTKVALRDRRRIQDALRHRFSTALPLASVDDNSAERQVLVAENATAVLARYDLPVTALVDEVVTLASAQEDPAAARWLGRQVRALLAWPDRLKHPITELVNAATQAVADREVRSELRRRCLARLAAFELTPGELARALQVPAEIVLAAIEAPDVLSDDAAWRLAIASDRFSPDALGSTVEWSTVLDTPAAEIARRACVTAGINHGDPPISVEDVVAMASGARVPSRSRLYIDRAVRTPASARKTQAWAETEMAVAHSPAVWSSARPARLTSGPDLDEHAPA